VRRSSLTIREASRRRTVIARVIRIYHRLPAELIGDFLHPLNVLRDVAPAAYAREVEKYAGREQLRDEVVTPLGVRWSDVIHFSPVHPAAVREALVGAGGRWPAGRTTWLEVDPQAIPMGPENACLFFSRLTEQSWFAPYADELIRANTDLPRAVVNYYASCVAAGNRPLLFNGVMHVLYRGSIDPRNGRVLVV